MTTLPNTPISLPQHIDSTMLSVYLQDKLNKHLFFIAALDYHKETGHFTWKQARANYKIAAGSRAGTIRFGYEIIQMKLGAKLYRVFTHNLVWVVETGKLPFPELDHRDKNSLNNQFDNLREATRQQNNRNRSKARNNTSGATGVSWNCSHKRWIAYVYVNGRRIDLGRFKNKLNAIECRLKNEAKYFGEFGVQQ